MALRVEDCPNCDHKLAEHALTADSNANGSCGADACKCPLDRESARFAIAVAAALVKFG